MSSGILKKLPAIFEGAPDFRTLPTPSFLPPYRSYPLLCSHFLQSVRPSALAHACEGAGGPRRRLACAGGREGGAVSGERSPNAAEVSLRVRLVQLRSVIVDSLLMLALTTAVWGAVYLLLSNHDTFLSQIR